MTESQTGPNATGVTRVRIAAKNGEIAFDCEPGERILHAGLRSGFDLPYECASGTCGTCKATLEQGATRDEWPEAPARKYLKPGTPQLLMCQNVALTDVTLSLARAVTTHPEGRFAPAATRGTLAGLRDLAPGVMTFDVRLEHPMSFEAGQFVLLTAPGVQGARSYSMVNFARDTARLEFLVKRLPDGKLTDWLFTAARDGDEVAVFGPLGRATFDSIATKHVVCIAGGSGIAGMMAILAHALSEGHFDRHDGRVFFGLRTPADAFYLDELAALAQAFPDRLRVTIVLSHEAPSQALRDAYPGLLFDEGFVHEAAKRALDAPLVDTTVFVAGPPPMVDAALRMLLLELKVSGANIRYDKFS